MKSIATSQESTGRQIEGTRSLVAAIAADLRKRYGGHGRLDEAGAERHLGIIVAQARRQAAKADVAAPDGSGCMTGILPGRGAIGRRGAGARGSRRATTSGAGVRTALVSRVRREIADGSYETVEKLEAALCGLAGELGV